MNGDGPAPPQSWLALMFSIVSIVYLIVQCLWVKLQFKRTHERIDKLGGGQ